MRGTSTDPCAHAADSRTSQRPDAHNPGRITAIDALAGPARVGGLDFGELGLGPGTDAVVHPQ